MTTIVLLTISNIFMTFAWYAFEVQASPDLHRDSRQLGHRLFRVLFSSARQPNWLVRIQRGTAKDDSGSNHPDRIFGILGVLSRRTDQVELHIGLRFDRAGGVCDFQKMVTARQI
jgi:hypothetical protein